jgi:hypothetical protein
LLYSRRVSLLVYSFRQYGQACIPWSVPYGCWTSRSDTSRGICVGSRRSEPNWSALSVTDRSRSRFRWLADSTSMSSHCSHRSTGSRSHRPGKQTVSMKTADGLFRCMGREGSISQSANRWGCSIQWCSQHSPVPTRLYSSSRDISLPQWWPSTVSHPVRQWWPPRHSHWIFQSRRWFPRRGDWRSWQWWLIGCVVWFIHQQ